MLPIPHRRASHQRAEVTQQLIVFRIQQERFALPIQAILKVIPMGQTYGAGESTGVQLMSYQNQEVVVLNVSDRLFRNAATRHLQSTPSMAVSAQPTRFVLLLYNRHGELMGIPIDETPTLQRVPKSAFAPLSPTYLAEGNVQCVQALVIPNRDEPPLFLLNLDQLFHAPPKNAPSSTLTSADATESHVSSLPAASHEWTDSAHHLGDRPSDGAPRHPLRHHLSAPTNPGHNQPAS